MRVGLFTNLQNDQIFILITKSIYLGFFLKRNTCLLERSYPLTVLRSSPFEYTLSALTEV